MHKKQSFYQILLPIILITIIIGTIGSFLIAGSYSGKLILSSIGNIASIYLIVLVIFPFLIIFFLFSTLIILLSQAPDHIKNLFNSVFVFHKKIMGRIENMSRNMVKPFIGIGSLNALFHTIKSKGMKND